MAELLDIVNVDDRVIGITDKETAHQTGQLHRVVAVYVLNNIGELYVQIHKSSGGLFDHSVGGHVSSGESYEEAAIREADEELNITEPLTHLATFYSQDEPYRHMFGLFSCTVNEEWEFVPNDEVSEVVPMPIDNVFLLMKSNPEKFTGGFLNTMEEYLRILGATAVQN
jgi:isopentenyldiphosphate isomerase